MISTPVGLAMLTGFLILAIILRLGRRLRPWSVWLSLLAGLVFLGSLVTEGILLAGGDRGIVVLVVWSSALGWALFLIALLTSVVGTSESADADETDPGVEEYLAVRAEKERERVRQRMDREG
jgi:hypothetical protein